MRDYKFRGKRVDNGEWIYGDLIHREPDGIRNYIHPYFNPMGSIQNHPEEVIPESVCQYTGFLDREGNELYEEDIVKDDDGIALIKWDEERAGYSYFVLYEDGGLCREDSVAEFNNYCEVIGNIHDNPSLLEVQP